MPLIVNDMSTLFNIVIAHEDEKLIFTFRQLTYREKNKITSYTTEYKQGQAVVDTSLVCFYVIKYGLVKVEGLLKEDGTPWELVKTTEDNIEVNSDESIDALLNTQVSNGLIWAANAMTSGIPKEIVNPLNGRKIEGVEIVPIKGEDAKKK
jgi:hypothetical protein